MKTFLKVISLLVFVTLPLCLFGQSNDISKVGLVAHYPFAGNANDASGNGNHGILEGYQPQLTHDRHGNAESAYLFGGVGRPGWIRVPNSNSMKVDNSLTVVMWLRQDDWYGMDGWGSNVPQGNFCLFSKGGDGIATYPGLFMMATYGDDGQGIRMFGSNVNGNSYDQSLHNFDYNVLFPYRGLGDWLHIALVVNERYMRIYVNGQLAQEEAMDGTNFSKMNEQDLFIGIMGSGSPHWYPYAGVIDDVRMYRRAISASEVRQLYNNEKGEEVSIYVNSVNINLDSQFLTVGQTAQASAEVSPANATNKELVWLAFPSTVASVDQNGFVTALKPGMATISCHTKDGSMKSASRQIYVEEDKSGMTYGEVYAYHGFIDYTTPKQVSGVTADGKTEVFVNHPAMDFALEFTDAEGNLIYPDENERGNLRRGTDAHGNSGIIYQAPADYHQSAGSCYYAHIKVMGNDNRYTDIAKVSIHRPGLALVHGLFSDGESFADFYEYLTTKTDYVCEAKLVDYQTYNTASFHANTHFNNVIQGACEEIYDKLLQQGILSTAYDFVGHSMGGILSRLYAQERNKEAAHKIITVNTPHYGSAIADLGKGLHDIIDQFVDAYVDAGVYYTPLMDFMTFASGWLLDNPAVDDLRSDSQPTILLNKGASKLAGIPVHAVCSYVKYLEIEDVIPATVCIPLAGFLVGLDAWFNGMVFDLEDHDGIVELSSQKAGLEGYKSTVEDAYGADCFGLSSPAHHCNTTSWEDTHENLVKLLSKSVDSYVFSKTGYVDMNSAQSGNSKRMAPARPARQLKPADNADTFVRIATHDIEIVNDSIFLSLTIDKSDDIASTLLMSRLDDDHNLVAMDCSSARMVLPFHLPGEYTLTLLGRTDDFAVTCDTIHYTVPATATPEYLMFDDTPSYLIVGQKVACATKVTWDNQQTTFVKADIRSSDESVVKVIDGRLSAVGAGECVLTATWEGNIADMVIKVEDYGQSTAISAVRSDAVADFALSGDNLILKTPRGMNGLDVEVTLCDINGEILKTIRTKTSDSNIVIPVNDISRTFIATCNIDGNTKATRKFRR